MAIKAPVRRCAAEASPKKTDSLTHMSARALTLTKQWYGQIWTGVPGNCLRPRLVSSPYFWSECLKCTVARTTRDDTEEQHVTSSSKGNAPTTKCHHSQLRKWREYFPG